MRALLIIGAAAILAWGWGIEGETFNIGAQHELAERSPWILVPDAAAVARRLRSAFPALGDRWQPQLGTKTGAELSLGAVKSFREDSLAAGLKLALPASRAAE